MDLDAFKALVDNRIDNGVPMRIGDGLIHCGHCGCELYAIQPRQSGYAHTMMYYQCANDCKPSARTDLVDIGLHKFTRDRLSDPGGEWQRTRIALIDADLAFARELWAWYSDPENRRRVRRAHAWWRKPHTIPLMLFGYEPLWEVRAYFYALAERVAKQVVAFAGQPVRADDRALLTALTEAWAGYEWVYGDWGLLPRPARVRRHEAAQGKFWDLLVSTRWSGLGPAKPLVDDSALAQEWDHHGMLKRRRTLLRLAIGLDRLVVHRTDAGPQLALRYADSARRLLTSDIENEATGSGRTHGSIPDPGGGTPLSSS